MFSSLKPALIDYPSASNNTHDRSRSLTERLTKIKVDVGAVSPEDAGGPLPSIVPGMMMRMVDVVKSYATRRGVPALLPNRTETFI